MQNSLSHRHAFSLVELSIVLVILGLLVGGILAGQSLIRAAELRSVTEQAKRYDSAIYTFRDKYFAFPGDMTNAVRFWGAQAGATTDGYDATCAALATAATGTATCNGNGDGIVGAGWPIIAHEQFRAWQHLANAGLIEGSYAGVGIGGLNTSVIGQNIPTTRLSNVGAAFYWIPAASSAAYYFPSVSNTVALSFASIASGDPSGYSFIPSDLWNIDTKVDDGKPGTGKIFAQGTSASCTTSNLASATYVLTTSTPLCTMYWRLVN